jgi:hypothetical protein
MTTKRIVFSRPDGGVSVIIPAPQYRRPGEDDGPFLARVLARNQEVGHAPLEGCTVVDVADLPPPRLRKFLVVTPAGEVVETQRRLFRGCWRMAGGRPVEDEGLCRDRTLAEVRKERDARLDASDKDKARLDDVGTPGQQQAHRQYRQALRDLPAVVAQQIAAMTPDELEAYQAPWPQKPE